MTAQDVLSEILRTGQVRHPDGNVLKVVANISKEYSNALHNFVLERKPRLCVEIGMAYGVSTLSILSALQKTNSGNLISIDPYIGWPSGRIVALHQVALARAESMHSHWHECSYTALPRMLEQGMKPDLIYIDGNHNFDYVFTDAFYADKLLRVGGVIAFNDCGWRPVHKVLCFLKAYRHYRELDVGLPRAYRGRNYIYSFIKRLEGRSSSDRYFEKADNWEPDHGFYRPF